jgi:hypothetical protein
MKTGNDLGDKIRYRAYNRGVELYVSLLFLIFRPLRL